MGHLRIYLEPGKSRADYTPAQLVLVDEQNALADAAEGAESRQAEQYDQLSRNARERR